MTCDEHNSSKHRFNQTKHFLDSSNKLFSVKCIFKQFDSNKVNLNYVVLNIDERLSNLELW